MRSHGGFEGGKHHLKKRVVTEIAFGLKFLDDLFKWNVGVGKCAQNCLACLSDQIRESRIAGQVIAQDQGVDEEPDQPLRLHLVTARDRDSHHDVILFRMATKQDLKRSQLHHEGGGTAASCDFLNSLDDVARDGCDLNRPFESLFWRPRSIGWQFQKSRRRLQFVSPIIELLLYFAGVKPLQLPLRKVTIPNRQRGQGRRLAARKGTVELFQFFCEDLQ